MGRDPAVAEAIGSTRQVLDELRALLALTSNAAQRHGDVADAESEESTRSIGVEARASPTGSSVLDNAGKQAGRKTDEMLVCRSLSHGAPDALRLADAIITSVGKSR